MSLKALAAKCGSRVTLGVAETILEGLLVSQGLNFVIGCIGPVIYTS